MVHLLFLATSNCQGAIDSSIHLNDNIVEKVRRKFDCHGYQLRRAEVDMKTFSCLQSGFQYALSVRCRSTLPKQSQHDQQKHIP